jgi:hypothetical protein
MGPNGRRRTPRRRRIDPMSGTGLQLADAGTPASIVAMSVKSVKLETDYEVGDAPVRISILIGDGQFGTSVMWVGEHIFGPGDIEDVVLGTGPDLIGETLVIKSNVTDINDQTNHTSVTYDLDGGMAAARHVVEAIVDEEGDSVIYRTRIRFVETKAQTAGDA